MDGLLGLTFICMRNAVRKVHAKKKPLWKPFLTIPSTKGTGREVIMETLMVNKKYPKNSCFGQKGANYQLPNFRAFLKPL